MPLQIVCELQASSKLMLTMSETNADPNSEVLGKEDKDWMYYDEDDEGYEPIKTKKFFE